MTNHPVEILKQEHRVIEKVLDAFEVRLDRLDEPPFPETFFEQALDFFRYFADGIHHHKEEEVLFPVLEQSGLPREGGPTGCMLKEHEYGRRCLAEIRAQLSAAVAGSEEARQAVREHGYNYIAMLREHIRKEDEVLFRLAQTVLTTEEVEALGMRFRESGEPHVSASRWQYYAALAERLHRECLLAAF